ncbi:MAG: mechanosensitive ion channel domain-containing protein [Candidatus Woesearchaeota archaeon]
MTMNNTTLAQPPLFQSSELISSVTVAFILFIIGLILGRVLGKVVEKILKEFKVGEAVRKKTKLKTSFEKVVSGFVSYSIYTVFFILALNKIGITAVILNIVAILIVVVLAISLILSIKDSMPNIIAYRKLSGRKDVAVGKTITVQNITGVIEELTIFELKVRTSSGDVIHIPNSLLMTEVYKTYAGKRSSGKTPGQTTGAKKPPKKKKSRSVSSNNV